MNSKEFQVITKKAIRGAFSLTFRRIFLLVVNFITLNIILAKILPVSTLGVFIIANSILAFFTFFSDIGLAAALIRKKTLEKNDLETTFTIQEILAGLITLIVFIAAPLFVSIYKLDEGSTGLIRALAIGFLLTSFKVIPSVLLERDLNFGKLVWVEVIETFSFNLLLIVLTMFDFGLLAFTYSVLVRSSLGLMVIYIIAPWRLSFGFSKLSAKELLSFGVPFQLNSMLALLKDRLVPLVIAGIVGPVGVGFIGQGQRIAFLPLEVMNIATRVAFPTFSRLQGKKNSLKVILEQSLFITGFFLYPMAFGILAISPSLMKFLGSKWEGALPLIYLFSITTFWATLSTSLTNFLNAIGKISITLKLMIMWTVLEWILAPLFTLKFGYIGMGISSAIISFTSIIPIIIVKREISIDIAKNIWQPLVASIVMASLIFPLTWVLEHKLPTIMIMILTGGVIYLLLMSVFAKNKLSIILREVKYAVFHK